jgi:hypothetical protein
LAAGDRRAIEQVSDPEFVNVCLLAGEQIVAGNARQNFKPQCVNAVLVCSGLQACAVVVASA